ncbi:hypothetical protein NCCP2716_27610 [Sporosarcina sp. NCCP-2716]|uniref:hypothetical protein n=1 Tax=Sporosarcina sp. NCCP-2716 TaxID=2943679 RepID=UPI00203A7741|nr:hypothetical protein [Sporosarcina sp. NCCP-2716]GKV70263.1 hypothetical protein NCCP2716_27610 [Sporosarcina sp. NCCP-2716]
MTKREKYPPLKPWQQAVVKKHQMRDRLTNGTPYDQAKYAYMTCRDMSEEEFDKNSEQVGCTSEFQRILFRRKFIRSVNDFAESLAKRLGRYGR